MSRSIRRQLRVLQVYAATTFLVFAGLAMVALIGLTLVRRQWSLTWGSAVPASAE